MTTSQKNNEKDYFVESYAIDYHLLTHKLKLQVPVFYDFMILQTRYNKCKEGYILKRLNKANSKGTRIWFKLAKSEDELLKELMLIKSEFREMHEKMPEFEKDIEVIINKHIKEESQ